MMLGNKVVTDDYNEITLKFQTITLNGNSIRLKYTIKSKEIDYSGSISLEMIQDLKSVIPQNQVKNTVIDMIGYECTPMIYRETIRNNYPLKVNPYHLLVAKGMLITHDWIP